MRSKTPHFEYTKLFRKNLPEAKRIDVIFKSTLRKFRAYYLNHFKIKTGFLEIKDSSRKLVIYLDLYVKDGLVFQVTTTTKNFGDAKNQKCAGHLPQEEYQSP